MMAYQKNNANSLPPCHLAPGLMQGALVWGMYVAAWGMLHITHISRLID
jgi:hypothetical protein